MFLWKKKKKNFRIKYSCIVMYPLIAYSHAMFILVMLFIIDIKIKHIYISWLF